MVQKEMEIEKDGDRKRFSYALVLSNTLYGKVRSFFSMSTNIFIYSRKTQQTACFFSLSLCLLLNSLCVLFLLHSLAPFHFESNRLKNCLLRIMSHALQSNTFSCCNFHFELEKVSSARFHHYVFSLYSGPTITYWPIFLRFFSLSRKKIRRIQSEA